LNPIEKALLLQREIHEGLLPFHDELRGVQPYPTQKVVPPCRLIALVVENVDLKHVAENLRQIPNVELQHLVPCRVEIAF
jgi:hypothetical protein